MKLRPLILALALSVLLCGCTRSAPKNFAENVAPDASVSDDISSLEELCRHSNTIIKAKYIDSESFSGSTSEFRFKLERDFIGSVDEDTLHVYESSLTTLIPGKSYYLFMTGHVSCVYPHITFGRICPEFLPGELDGELTFYGGNTLGLPEDCDLDGLIEQLVADGDYSSEGLERETPEQAFASADRILLVTVTGVTKENRYLATCEYVIDRVLRGPEDPDAELRQDSNVPEDVRAAAGEGTEYKTPAPASTKTGDRLVLLFRQNPKSGAYELYSGDSFLFPADDASIRPLLAQFD